MKAKDGADVRSNCAVGAQSPAERSVSFRSTLVVLERTGEGAADLRYGVREYDRTGTGLLHLFDQSYGIGSRTVVAEFHGVEHERRIDGHVNAGHRPTISDGLLEIQDDFRNESAARGGDYRVEQVRYLSVDVKDIAGDKVVESLLYVRCAVVVFLLGAPKGEDF